MTRALRLDPERCLPLEPAARRVAAELFEATRGLPLLSPHGHADPAWFAVDAPFEDAVSLILWPDHYLLRMLYSQGASLESLGIAPKDGAPAEGDRRSVWRRFAAAYHLFRATPSRLWLDQVFAELFGLTVRLEAETADLYYDAISEALARPEFRPRALFETFRVEALATTEGALDPLAHHHALRASGWPGRVIPTFRPDDVTDPDRAEFADALARLGEMTGENTAVWSGYLAALRGRRAAFKAMGATATDHGPPNALTADLAPIECQGLLDRRLAGRAGAGEAELFRGQMLTEMAAMSLDDGLVMQLHPGSRRNHNPWLFERFGPDRGADIPVAAEFTRALAPLLAKFGNRADFTLILFTLDEATYARELAPLAGHYPCLRLGAPWWFNDSFEGMLRFRRQTTETSGLSNLAGFVDDTRAFISIPARHELARRVDCGYLGELVAGGRLELDEAHEVAADLAFGLAKAAYHL